MQGPVHPRQQSTTLSDYLFDEVCREHEHVRIVPKR